VGRRLKGAQGWTFVGCDPVEGRGISRLGTQVVQICYARGLGAAPNSLVTVLYGADWRAAGFDFYSYRSEEHTSEPQSRFDLVCRLLLEKKKRPPKHPYRRRTPPTSV